MNRRDIFSCLAAVAVTALSYHAFAAAQFVYDNSALIASNPQSRSIVNIAQWFSGLGPSACLFISLAIHCANTALIFHFARRYLSAIAAAAAAIAFGVHPAQVESVARMGGPAAASFGILASLYIVACSKAMAGETPRGGVHVVLLWIASFLFSFLAFVTNEPSLAIPAAVFVVEFFVSKSISTGESTGKSAGWKRFLPYLAAAAAALLYYTIRIWNLAPGAGFELKQTEFALPDWRVRSLRFELLKDYFLTAAYPFDLNMFRTLQLDWTETSKPIRDAWLAAMGIVAMYGALAALAIRYHIARAPLAFLLFFLLAAAPLLISPVESGYFIFAERYLYIPNIGIALLLGWLFDTVSKKTVLLGFLILIPVLGSYIWKTLGRVPVWHDEFSLFSESEKASPDSATVKCALGGIFLSNYQNSGDQASLDLAFDKFRSAIDHSLRDRVYVSNQDVIRSYLGVASIQMIRGRNDDALSIFEQVAERFPDCAEAYDQAGVALSRIGNYDRAEENFKKAISLRPRFVNAYINLGNLYINRGTLALAIQPLREAIRIEPANAHAYLTLATALFNLDQKAEAARTLAQYLEKYPAGPGSDRVRAALTQMQKQ